MQFELTEDQRMVQKTARDFATNEVLPQAAAIDREHRHPAELVARMAELGLLGIAVPEAHGGSGFDHVSYVLAMEEVCRACASTGVIMSVNNSLVCDPIGRFGTDAQKARWLTPLAQGKLLGCFALSEPEAGSDAAAQKTTAVRDGEAWLINGTKNWITNGPVADVCVLFTMNDKRGRPPGHHRVHPRRWTRQGRRIRAAGRQARHPRQQVVPDLPRRCPPHRRAPARRGRRRLQGGDGHARRRPHRDRRAGGRHRARRARGRRASTRCSARRSASRSPSTRRSSSSSPTWRPRSTRPGC